MRLSRKGFIALGLATALFALPACSKDANTGGGGTSDTEVEVFSWWAGPGEKEGLEAMIADFRAKNPGITFNNAAIAGGAGTNAKTVLASRLQANNPPDSYQVHAGLELASDIEAGYVEDLTYLYDREGWKDKFPQGLIDAITVGRQDLLRAGEHPPVEPAVLHPEQAAGLGDRRTGDDLVGVPDPGGGAQGQERHGTVDRPRLDPEAPPRERAAR